MADKKLTERQIKFIEAYKGNGTEAARQAGYTGDDNALAVMANKLLRNANILNAIKGRQDISIKPLIADRKRRQEFWASVMEDRSEDMRNRLRASELLGKSEADFTEKIEHSGKLTMAELVAGSIRKEKERKNDKEN